MDELSPPNREQQQYNAKSRCFQHFANPAEAQIAAHEHGDRNRRANCENSPRTFRQRFHYDQREHCQQNDHNRQNRDERDPTVGLQEDGATFTIPRAPVRRRIHGIETFHVLRGGEYFFLPSLSALRWLAEER